MSNIYRLPRPDEADQQASAWIARLQADDASAADRARFDAWRAAHPRHARAYDEQMATWRQLATLGRTERLAPAAPRRRYARIALAAAGVLALGMGVTGVLWSLRQPPATFATGIGEQASLTLPDGSRLDLNSDSAVRVAYRPGARVVRLDRGEAFFNVVHDASRPFWVTAGSVWVRDVGTAFNVSRRDRDVQVTVSEGQVKVVEAPGSGASPSDAALARLQPTALGAGDQVDMHGGQARLRRLPAAVLARDVSWRTGTVAVENRPLHEVVDELRPYTPLQIELAPGVRDLPVGGTFQATPQGADALLRMLHDGFGLTVKRLDGKHVRVE